MSYTTKYIDGVRIDTQQLPDRSLRLKIARHVVGIGLFLIFIMLLQLITTIEATRVMDYKIAHNDFKPITNHK